MRIKLLLIFVLFNVFANADKPLVKWAKGFGGNNDDLSQSLAVDASGNVFITGYFSSSSITFGSFTLNNPSGQPHIFVVKYDSIGNVKWAKSTGDYDVGYALSISVDKSGNAFISGFFRSTLITFGSFNLSNNNDGYGKLFLVKYDSFGNVIWANTSTNTATSNSMNSIWADNFGNIYTTGHFQDNTISFGSITLINNNAPYQCIF